MESPTERHWADNVADLLSGRMHNSFMALNLEHADLRNRYEELINMATQNEQRLMAIASALMAAMSGISAKIDTLTQQAQSPTPTPPAEVEDLTEELAAVDEAVASLQALASSGSGSGSGETTDPNAPPADGGPAPTDGVGVPVMPDVEQPNAPEPIPAPGTEPTEGGTEPTEGETAPVDPTAGEFVDPVVGGAPVEPGPPNEGTEDGVNESTPTGVAFDDEED